VFGHVAIPRSFGRASYIIIQTGLRQIVVVNTAAVDLADDFRNSLGHSLIRELSTNSATNAAKLAN
jgi:hypothetical protein